ncbi:MAG: leucine-rich repeat domain-containing protein [Bacteroidota bacterium]
MKHLFVAFFLFIPFLTQAQCEYFEKEIHLGDSARTAQDYPEAIRHYTLALTLCPSRSREAQHEIQEVFVRIDRLKDQAQESAVNAEKSLERANLALRQAKIAEEQRMIATEAEKEAQWQRQEALQDAYEALERATLMQQKMETAVFDRAMRELFPKYWKGYENFAPTDKLDDMLLKEADTLDLSQSNLFRIPREVAECPNLVITDLRENPELEWQTIDSIKSGGIYISVEDLDAIPEKYWKKIVGITYQESILNQVPEKILEQKQLHLLVLEGPNFFDQPDGSGIVPLVNLPELSFLEITFGSLAVFPEELCQLDQLSHLDFSFNDLKALPENFTALQKLKYLQLESNQFTEVPKEVFQLDSLKTLNLMFNEISKVPPQIANLEELRTLILRSNKLTSLPKQIKRLKNLRYLDLRNNPISGKEQGRIKKLLPDCKIEF